MDTKLPSVPSLTTQYGSFQSHDFGGGYRSLEIDTDVKPDQLTGGQNVDVNGNSIEKRKGHLIYGSVSGFSSGVLDQIAHTPPGGTAEMLRVWGTAVERYVSGTWTALTGVTMTAGQPANSAYFPLTAKTYVVNGTDNVVKYASGSSGDQTDGSFKKGKYIVEYKNRLIVAGVGGQSDYWWYTDLGVDTFSTNNYVRVNGTITGVKTLYDKLIILTDTRIYVVQNFTFNGVAAGPESMLPLRGDINCVAHRTFRTVGNLAYFLGINSEGLCAVYVTDGLTIGNEPVSLPIYQDMVNLAPAQLSNACAGAWGRYYRISVPQTGQTSNNLEYTYDTSQKRWSPPYTNGVGGFSCYMQHTVNGQRYLFAGSQSMGATYQLNQVDYDEQLSQSFTSGQDTDGPVDANPAKRAAQGFKIPAMQSSTYYLTGVMLYLKKNAGTTTELTVRIETDSGGKPSGTLANANLTATIPAFSSTSYGWYYPKFTVPAALSTGTTYWIVLRHTTEGTGSSQYYWGYAASGTYASGTGASYASSAWTAQASADYLFGLTIEGDYDAYADTAAFYLAPIGQKFHLRDLFVDAKASGNYPVQVGLNTGSYNSFVYQDMTVASNGPVIGSTFVFGQSVLGGQLRSEQRLRYDAIRGYTLKIRFRNRLANQPFKIYGIRTRHEILLKIK